MTIVMGGVCHNGQIAKEGRWTDSNGHEFIGTGYTPCPKCDGKGCRPAPRTLEEKVEALAKELAALKRQPARADHED